MRPPFKRINVSMGHPLAGSCVVLNIIRSIAHDQPQQNFKYIWLDFMSRRKGSRKSGGRQKGTKNRRTQELEKAVSSTGITPLEYMLSVMRDPNAADLRR